MHIRMFIKYFGVIKWQKVLKCKIMSNKNNSLLVFGLPLSYYIALLDLFSYIVMYSFIVYRCYYVCIMYQYKYLFVIGELFLPHRGDFSHLQTNRLGVWVDVSAKKQKNVEVCVLKFYGYFEHLYKLRI